jgi:hypothetical protein
MQASMGAASRLRSATNGVADLLAGRKPGVLATEQPAATIVNAMTTPRSLCRPLIAALPSFLNTRRTDT